MRKNLLWVLFDRNVPIAWQSDEEGSYFLPAIRLSMRTAFMLTYPTLFDRIEHVCNKTQSCGCLLNRNDEFLQREPTCSIHALTVPVPATPETVLPVTDARPDPA